MEAKDTVMNLKEYNRFTKEWYIQKGISELWCKADALDAEYRATLEHQAEISSKAGIRKVVDWVEENCIGVDTPTDDPEDYIGIQSMGWQTFKKSKGIKEEK